MFYEFATLAAAKQRHADFRRLNREPFSIFQTARGTWAFWTGRK